jgi:hypothetical protein
MIKDKIIAILGMLSPLLYTFMWILGGIIVPGYNHIEDDVSSLFAVNAYRQGLFQAISIVCSVLLLIFFSFMHWSVNKGEGSKVGPIFFFIASILGVAVASFFPLDEGGELLTWRGYGHLILIALSGILTIVGMVLMYFRLRRSEGWKGFAIFSLVTAILAVILVIFQFIATGGPYMGLVERFMVTTYQIYYFVFGLFVFIRNPLEKSILTEDKVVTSETE